MDIALKVRRPIGPESRCLGGDWNHRRLIGATVVLWLTLLFTSLGEAADAPPKGAVAKPVDVAEWRNIPDLVTRLRRGGMVLYFRHAATDRIQKDQRPVELSNCAKQRNLSDEGRRQSQAIGEAFRTLEIPVGPVVASPFCRTIEMARLAFGRFEKADFLSFAIGISTDEKSKAEAALRKMLSEPPPAGQNRVVISHTANLKDATGIWPKPEGAAFVFEPRGAEGFRAVARIAPDAWSQIVAESKRPK